MLTQSPQRSALVALHQAGVANNIGCKNCRQFALLTHHGSVPRCLRRIIEGWRQLGNQASSRQRLGSVGLPRMQDQAFVCERRSHSGLVVDENHVLPDGLPADVQFICGEFWIGIANCQTAQDRQFRRDSQLRADDLGVP